MTKDFKHKVDDLRRRFREYGSAVVALSGGVDSAVLAKVAHEELGDNMVAVTAKSPSVPSHDWSDAHRICMEHNIPHAVVESDEFSREEFIENPADRCYHCKKALYDSLSKIAEDRGAVIVEGTNASDLSGHRPGYRASSERENVRTPLIESGMTKTEVRMLANELGLGHFADKPASACLSSRIPTGTKLTPKDLERIDRAETAIRSLGIGMVRVRHHGDLARIEVAPEDIGKVEAARDTIYSTLQKIGYRYITLDLKGYRPSIPF
jgi:uncharacterized protein